MKQGAPELNVAIWSGDAIQCDAHAGASKESDFHRRRGLSASSSLIVVMRLRLLIREVIIMRMPLQSADRVAVADDYVPEDAMFSASKQQSGLHQDGKGVHTQPFLCLPGSCSLQGAVLRSLHDSAATASRPDCKSRVQCPDDLSSSTRSSAGWR